jgi:hypothetical protein
VTITRPVAKLRCRFNSGQIDCHEEKSMRHESTTEPRGRRMFAAEKARQEGVSVSSLTRWILSGVLGRDGVRHKLAASRCGGRWVIFEDDFERFMDALSRLPADAREAEIPTPAARSGAHERLEREAAAFGLL